MNSLIRATARDHRAGAEGQLLTAGLVHPHLCRNEIDDRRDGNSIANYAVEDGR
jgi:hypothetical protein